MKRENGTGSVYKLSGTRRKPWIAVATVGFDTEGKQLRKTLGTFAKRDEAHKALIKYNVDGFDERIDITVWQLYEEVSEKLYQRASQGEVTEKYVKNLLSSVKYIPKNIRKARVKDIKLSHVEDIFESVKGRSRSTKNNIKILLSYIFKRAMGDKIVNTDLTTLITIKSTPPVKETRIFTEAEITHMWKNVNKVEWADTILILIYTGMRVSELLELTKFKVDLDKQALLECGNKTAAGRRKDIPIHPRLLPIIAKWYEQSESEYLISKDGEPLTYDHYYKSCYNIALEKLGFSSDDISKLTPHQCRHTAASRYDKVEDNKEHIIDLMGHTDYTFTNERYIHRDVERLRETVKKLD